MVGAPEDDVDVVVVVLPEDVVPLCVLVVVDVTVIENGARLAVCLPSFTLMTTFEYVPALALEGKPVSAPVEMLKLAHEGLLVMEYASAEVEDLTTGAKAYVDPAATLVGGVPEMLSVVLHFFRPASATVGATTATNVGATRVAATRSRRGAVPIDIIHLRFPRPPAGIGDRQRNSPDARMR